MFHTKFVEKIKTRIICSITIFFFESVSFMRNVEKYGTAGQATDDNTIQRMRFACWIPMTTHTRVYVNLIVFPRQHWLRERASMLGLYVHWLSCYSSINRF
jgi:hypothetical protein